MVTKNILHDMMTLSQDIYNDLDSKPQEENSSLNQGVAKTHLAENELIYWYCNNVSTDLQMAITLNHVYKRISIVFRGSDSLKDWYFDLMSSRKWLHGDIYIHKGFHRLLFDSKIGVYLNLTVHISTLLDLYRDYNMYVTGHSLGAALATLCGYQLSRDFEHVDFTVVSFASPRIGNWAWDYEFQKRANLHHTRVTHRCDIIPRLPFWYYHVGKEVQLLGSLSWPWKAHTCDTYICQLNSAVHGQPN